MDEYIKREALLEEIDRRFEESPIEDTNAWMVGRRIVRKFPASDVEPVRHGHWIYHEIVASDDGTISAFECSCCGAAVKEETFDLVDFHKNRCGECGAKMDEEITEE